MTAEETADLRAELGIAELKEAIQANGAKLDRLEGLIAALLAELGADVEPR